MRETRIIIGTLMDLPATRCLAGKRRLVRTCTAMRMKVGDEECMMGYTHAARYETVNFERSCRRCSQRKGPSPFKDAWKTDGQHIMLPARWRPATWQR